MAINVLLYERRNDIRHFFGAKKKKKEMPIKPQKQQLEPTNFGYLNNIFTLY